MPFNKFKSNDSDTRRVKPFYIDSAKVLHVSVLYPSQDTQATPGPDGTTAWRPDIQLMVALDIGASFNPTLRISGSYKKDDDGNIISIGTAFKVERFFQVLDIKDSFDEKIPQDILNKAINKSFFKLRYIWKKNEEGVNKYLDWDIISKSKEGLEKEFLRSVDRGYVKNYNPHLISLTTSKVTTEVDNLPW